MRTILLCLLGLLMAMSLWGQVQLTGLVVDQASGKPIPFVNIGVIPYGKGTVSGQNGEYALQLPDTKEMVTFSAIGYETMDIETEALVAYGNVSLIPKAYSIPTIDLSAKRFGSEQVLGGKLEEKGHSVGFGSGQLGTQIAALIPIERETLLKSAHFHLNHAKGDSLLFRVNLYQMKDGQVGEQLLPENVFLYGPQKAGELMVDLSDFHLILEQDVLLGLEWVQDDQGKGNSGITFRAGKSRKEENTYYRFSSQGTFQRMSKAHALVPKLQLGFYLLGKQVEE